MSAQGKAEPNIITGLTSSEVAERVAQGKTNANTDVKTKSIGQIMREHAFTLFNFVNLALAVLVIITGQYRNMTFMLVVLINLVIGVVQEVRAKQMVDKLSILTAK
ncbi:MAG: haloacid dehalogenase, partial [Atopobiaceae bacterium]|nr:haloacid dehalogenase [Atopobiaceae bacterium]